MTADELKQEAEEYIKKENLEWELETYRVSAISAIKEAYIASAEPREKRIAELERKYKSRCDKFYELDNMYEELILKNKELKKENAESKTLIRKLYHWHKYGHEPCDDLWIEAENFLSEVEE